MKARRFQRRLKVCYTRYPTGLFVTIFVAVLAFWVANAIVMKAIFGEFAKAGPAGDSFGAITSLFTGLAFVGLIATLILQQKELKLQRRELRLQRDEVSATRKELAGQKKQMELQNESLRLQMFEQTLFNMIRLFNDYISDISRRPSSTTSVHITGRDSLSSLVTEYIVYAENAQSAASKYIDLYQNYSDDLGGYFRLIYNILKFIDQSEIGNKKQYSNILRAQLSDGELVLISLNLQTPLAAKSVDLMNKYEMTKHTMQVIGRKKMSEIMEHLKSFEYTKDQRVSGK